MFKLQSDLAYDEDTLGEALERIGREHPNVYARVVEANGPGGGWPDIEWVTFDRESMEAFVEWYAGGDEQQREWMWDEWVTEV